MNHVLARYYNTPVSAAVERLKKTSSVAETTRSPREVFLEGVAAVRNQPEGVLRKVSDTVRPWLDVWDEAETDGERLAVLSMKAVFEAA